MKIAIDISPVSESSFSSHKVRGVGSYISLLKNNLEKVDTNNTYNFFTHSQRLPSDTNLVHYPYFELFFKSLPYIPPAPFVVTVHDVIPLKFPKHFPSGLRGNINLHIQKYLLSKAHAVITDSKTSKQDIAKLLNVPIEKIKVVYLAADEAYKKVNDKKKLLELQKKYNLPTEFVLYVGDATWNKNLPTLIAAIKKTKVPLVMIGKAIVEKVEDLENVWNQDLISVQKDTSDHNLFIKLGYVPIDDLTILYNLATLCIIPSLYEGFGLPVLEAMQSGCPVITSKNSSLAEVGEEAVFYIDPYSIESISEGIIKLMKNETLRKKLTQLGLHQARKFTINDTVRQTVSIYENCVNK